MLKKTFAALLMVTIILTVISGCSRSKEISETTLMLDTICSITLYEPADQELLNTAIELCAEYEKLFSRTINGSDVYRINQAQGQPVEIDPRTTELIRQGLFYGELSNGKFDITIGRLSSLWDFGTATTKPDETEIQAALETVDYRQVHLDGNTVWLDNPEAMLELGGIAKGYIADQLADYLIEQGVTCALINLGGNILTIGSKADGAAWHIGVEQPFSERTKLVGTLTLDASSVVTSGIYERQFIQDGVMYHHILDPDTGYPANNELTGVTIVSDSSTAGDALSTICLILGYESGTDLLRQLDGIDGAVWIDRNGDVATSGNLNFQ